MITNIHCSKLSRAMNCPGSLFLQDQLEDQPNDAAKEGTAAGEYLERLMLNTPIGTHARNGIPFNDEMKFHAETIAANIKANSDPSYYPFCEEKIDWQTKSGITIKGKFDVSTIGLDGKLYIHDLKYGYGLVEVKENWQLIGYAVGEIIRRELKPRNIVMVIHQPRPHHEDGPTRLWEVTYEQLLEYKTKIEEKMMSIVEGDKTLATGKQCQYCNAAPVCPAFNKAYHRGVDLVHDFIQDGISDEELAYQLDLLKRVEELVKTRRGSLDQLTVSRLKEGKIIPNYSMEPNYAHRSWRANITPDVVLMLTGKDITDKVIMSPAQAEKLGVPKKLMESLCDRKQIGFKITRSSSDLGSKIFGNQQPTIKEN